MIAALLLSLLAAPAREVREVMGTTAEVLVKGPADPAPALEAAFAACARVDEALSLAKEGELVRLNRAREGVVSGDVLAALRYALDVATASGGAFDPTLETLGNAAASPGDGPRAERRGLWARVGAAPVHLDTETGRVRLDPGTMLDFGGVARGFATDRALAALKAAGATAALVSLGGNSLGVFGEPLEVVVRNPELPGGPPWATFRVSEGHVSTSDLDQKLDSGVEPRILSVTVVAASGIEADALSRAVYVLGVDEGLALVARRGAAGVVLLRERGRAVVRGTPGFVDDYGLELGPGVVVRE